MKRVNAVSEVFYTGVLFSSEELQQENNLIYVAITRSMNTLVYVNTLVDEEPTKLLSEADYIDPDEEVDWREHQKQEN